MAPASTMAPAVTTAIDSTHSKAHAQPADSLLDKAKRLRPLFDRMGPVNEQLGALADEVVEALHQDGK